MPPRAWLAAASARCATPPSHSAGDILPLILQMGTDSQQPTPLPRQRGFLNPEVVIAFSFWTTIVCIVVAVMTCVLAIWQFTGTDALWRTVATCAVVGGGATIFAWANRFFGGYN
jgi:hypothetical protein